MSRRTIVPTVSVLLSLLCISGCGGHVSQMTNEMMIDIKIQPYESTVDEIHAGTQIDELADMIGGTNGCEDVAFFQYSPVEYEDANHKYFKTEYYIYLFRRFFL